VFAGVVAGELFVTIDHGEGYRSTDSWLGQTLVERGEQVVAGDVVALSGRGHPELPEDQLHFGVRLDGDYIDPLTVLGPRSAANLIRLAPLESSCGEPAWAEPPPASFARFSTAWRTVSPTMTGFVREEDAIDGGRRAGVAGPGGRGGAAVDRRDPVAGRVPQRPAPAGRLEPVPG